jgi:hypothetical protein
MATIEFTRVNNDDLEALFQMIERLVFTNEILQKQILELDGFSIAVKKLKEDFIKSRLKGDPF